jgi:putative ABC transport system substrate-binding protein
VTELVNSNVDVIVAWATPATIAARRATSAIPIVMVSVSDPVSLGFIASLARPGGNITGLTVISVELSAKLMELFAELVPGMKRVGVVLNPNNPGTNTAGGSRSLRNGRDCRRPFNAARMSMRAVSCRMERT